MALFTLFSFIFVISTSYSNQLEWNTKITERIVKPLVLESKGSRSESAKKPLEFHYKSHFGIIIKKATTFNLAIKAAKTIPQLYFSCYQQESHKVIEKSLSNQKTSIITFTTDFDCVPMTSITYNIPIELKITTKNWMTLPVYDTRNITLQTSREIENIFYENVKTFGFVENYYTQMLLSANDIKSIKSKKYSLYVGLQNQVHVVKYYNYLTGASRYAGKSNSFSYDLLEKYRIFIRSEKCKPKCTYAALHTSAFIGFPSGLCEIFNPTRGSSWALLHEIAHHYDIKNKVLNYGYTPESWTNIYAALYQTRVKYDKQWMKDSKYDIESTISNYRKGVPLKKWKLRQKLFFFLSFFGLDGTDKSFREFNIRYYSAGASVDNIYPIIFEVFLDLYNINLLPFFSKVADFNEYITIDKNLELRLLGGRPVMPAIDFNIDPTDLQAGNSRPYSPLMLMRKMKKKYVDVEFTIESPTNHVGRCLYLNNKCHTITGHNMTLQLLMDAYSIYIAENVNNKLYLSEIVYHTISKKTKIIIEERKRCATLICQPMINYLFEVQGLGDNIVLQIFINYLNLTIKLKQFIDSIHSFFKKELYFSIILRRNGHPVFEYKLLGISKSKEPLVDVVHEFQLNDTLNIFHAEPNRLKIDGEKFNNVKNNTFVFLNTGMRNVADRLDNKMVLHDIEKLNKFYEKYKIDLSYNMYYPILLAQYRNMLIYEGMEKNIPKDWIEF